MENRFYQSQIFRKTHMELALGGKGLQACPMQNALVAKWFFCSFAGVSSRLCRRHRA